ncbi:FAD-dependent oxidoreductase [Allorhizobium sp. BGMRC 0089]|uniref:GcvT family protein n=1 Tax=Allorhizobium sonneratiae TaxID=2934936 RepID=UPI002033C7BA|nr:FAD-dependent oxidoreductase [Allorhizobium sonneratiae]MCM2293941.1 FAD-dependent oxidoreductase [Allorhizobium sonneratiae]
MANEIPAQAQVVIIGGGVHGCSVAYHLAKEGWTDVVLLERKQLTSGTTWHAAGLVGRLRGDTLSTEFASYGTEIIEELERETGQTTGFRQTGSVTVARHPDRMRQLRRQVDYARLFNIEAYEIGFDEIQERYPLVSLDGIVGGTWIPSNGSINPVDLTNALAKGARGRGVKIFENTKVEEIIIEGGQVKGVRTDKGEIRCEFVVNTSGMWARELGRRNNVEIPLHACAHYYLVTEAIPDLPKNLPVLRSYDDATYFKEDAGKLLVGFGHRIVVPYGENGIPENFSFDSLPFVEEHVMDVMEEALERVPVLQTVGIRTFFNGPESFTHDGRATIGEAPHIKGYFILAGVNSTGIQCGAGAGRALAEWIINGHPMRDLSAVDPARMEAFQSGDLYLQQRAPETLALSYALHYPGQQRHTARNIRRTPLHHALKAQGAYFGEALGWERPAWYGPAGSEPVPEHSFGKTKNLEYSLAEQKAAREAVAIIDYSPMGKTEVEGKDAEAFLQRLCTNNMAIAPGRLIYTLMLNEQGGVESDMTVARMSAERFIVTSSTGRRRRDLNRMQSHIRPGEDVRVRDVTTASAALSIMGPKSRALLSELSGADLSNEAFPFNSGKTIRIGYAQMWIQRLSYSGELGYEIYMSPDVAEHVFETIMTLQSKYGIKLLGTEALNALRIDKGYLHWGTDMAYMESPHQLGVDFLCKTKKEIPFIGRDAYIARKAEAKGPYLYAIMLHDPEPLLFGREPVLHNGKVVGQITSASFSYEFGKATALGLLDFQNGPIDNAYVNETEFQVLVEGKAVSATVSKRGFYDPENKKMLS